MEGVFNTGSLEQAFPLFLACVWYFTIALEIDSSSRDLLWIHTALMKFQVLKNAQAAALMARQLAIQNLPEVLLAHIREETSFPGVPI